MDPRRRKLLDELRARQCREWALRTPRERFARADEMRTLAKAVSPGRSQSDEPLELVRKLADRRRTQARG